MTKEFCVYITVICDVTLKLPTFYIGSTSIEKINNAYHGSVKSRKYRDLWKNFIKENPDNITTHILSYHETRKEALEAEAQLQRAYNVVKHTSFVNQSIACQNGFFGIANSGADNPTFGRKHTDKTKVKMSIAKLGKTPWNKNNTTPDEVKEKISNSKKGTEPWNKGIDLPPHSEVTKAKMSASHKGKPKPIIICPHCNKSGGGQALMNRWHFDNCKFKEELNGIRNISSTQTI